jgi:hypothetical protein
VVVLIKYQTTPEAVTPTGGFIEKISFRIDGEAGLKVSGQSELKVPRHELV